MSDKTSLAGRPLDPMTLPARKGTGYPAHYATAIRDREKRIVGDAVGLTHFGVNLTRLPPGEISSQRHWHSGQDEFVYLLEGELVLVTDEGESLLRAGECAGFPAGRANGHRMVNRSDRMAVYLEVGNRPPGDVVTYPDIDFRAESEDGRKYRFTRRDGSDF